MALVTPAAIDEMPDHADAQDRQGRGPASPSGPVLVVHGGAGPRRTEDERSDVELRGALELAIDAGWRRLAAGAEAACVAAVCMLEDCPLFNAGIGSALAADAGVWCDATLMSGEGYAGAVAAVQGIRHPILAAQALAHADGGPLLWAGRSAELAALHHLELVNPELMVTERQRRRLAARLAHESERHATAQDDRGGTTGTVGAVCLDATGRLAAATSTGGFCGKAPARVGDSAVFGAGAWAHPLTCAVSATGAGEPFLRVLFAHQIHMRMLHGGQDLATAARDALAVVGDAGGLGGAICVGADGVIATPLSSEIMYRASRRLGQRTYTALGGPSAR